MVGVGSSSRSMAARRRSSSGCWSSHSAVCGSDFQLGEVHLGSHEVGVELLLDGCGELVIAASGFDLGGVPLSGGLAPAVAHPDRRVRGVGVGVGYAVLAWASILSRA